MKRTTRRNQKEALVGKTKKREKSDVADLLLGKIRQNLVDAVEAALEVHDKLIPEHGKYESFLENLVPSTNGFKVDENKLRDFHSVLHFVLLTTFGVDGKSQANVRAHLTNRETHPSPNIVELPYTHKVRESDEIALAELLRLANWKASAAARELEQVNTMVENELRRRGGARLRLLRAKGCKNEDCRRGLVSADYDTRKDFKNTCSDFQRDHLRNEPYPDGGARKVLCPVCQTQERQDELDNES
jgi:hypothetical protein